MTGTHGLPVPAQELVDRAAIMELVDRFGLYVDEKRFDELGNVLCEDVVAEIHGAEEHRIEGLTTVQEQTHQFLANFGHVHHMVTNILVEFDGDGDTATVRANLLATQVHESDDPAGVWLVKGVYDHRAVRTPSGWRLARTSLRHIWQQDTSQGPPGR